jgi:hypothetical protein
MPRFFRSRLLCVAGLLALAPALAAAQAVRPAPASAVDVQVMTSDSFLSAHPDLRNRLLGLKAFQVADYAQAMTLFRRAARYADKPSQAMVAEMLWQGLGGPANRPLAYVWMELAAERYFKVMLIQRERYWQALDAGERAQALGLGPAVFAEFSDPAAKPRLERALRFARRDMTGSRTGFVGSLRIVIPVPSWLISLDGSEYYQAKFWIPDAYWAWQAEDWQELPRGRGDVGPLLVRADGHR